MKLVCPQCSFSREVPDNKIPARTQLATCPKCNHRFQFRNLSETAGPDQTTLQPEPAEDSSPLLQDETSSADDIWDSLSAMHTDSGHPENQDKEDSFASAASPFASSQDSEDIPWENLDSVGFFPGFFETIKRVMRHPVDFFSKMPVEPGIGKPLVFYLLIAELQALAQFFWQLSGVIPMMNDGSGATAVGLGMMGMGSAFILILYPLLLTLMLFVMVGVNHLCLTLFKAANRGFAGTFRAVTYGSAPMVLAFFPFVGPILGALWSMVTTFFGYKYIHGTTTTRVVLAMLLPLLVMTVLVSVLFLFEGISPEQLR